MAATRWRHKVADPATAQPLSGATEAAVRYQPPKKMYYSHIFQRKLIGGEDLSWQLKFVYGEKCTPGKR